MNFRRFLILPLLAAALFSTAASLYSVPVVTAQQQGSAHAKKPAQFHYVCPMHEDVTSKKRATCPKCKMKLVRKPIVKEATPDSN